MFVPQFPEALNQHSFGPIDLLRDIGFSVLCFIWMYIATLSMLWFHGLIFKKRSFWTMNRASVVIGVAFAVMPLLILITRIIPGNTGGEVEIALMAATLIASVIVAIRIVLHDRGTSVKDAT